MNQEEAATQAEIDWMSEVDLVDPFYGPHDELERLLATAPTPTLKAWLADQIEANKAFSAHLFGGGSQK